MNDLNFCFCIFRYLELVVSFRVSIVEVFDDIKVSINKEEIVFFIIGYNVIIFIILEVVIVFVIKEEVIFFIFIEDVIVEVKDWIFVIVDEGIIIGIVIEFDIVNISYFNEIVIFIVKG